jgi:hypothetical protein
LRPTDAPLSLKFAELNEPLNYEVYLKLRRDRYDEDDISEMVKNEFFLACVDAFRRGFINGGDAQDKVYPDRNWPRDLSGVGYSFLQIEVARRLVDGRLALPPKLEERYPQAYRPENS